MKGLKRYIISLISRITQRINGIYTEGLLVKSGDFRFVVSSEDMTVGRQLRWNGTYGQEELNRLNKIISGNSNCLFVGTHVGAIALPIAKKVKRSCLVEANPGTFDLLNINCMINNIENCEIYNFAAGEEDGEINFLLSRVNSGGAKREPLIKKNMYYYDNPETIVVPMKRLDSFFVDRNFDMIFMDIEGSEYFALKGMTQLLKDAGSLVMEFIPHHLDNVANVSVDELVSLIEAHFGYLYIPSMEKQVSGHDFCSVLNDMYSKNMEDDGIIFSKSPISF